MQADERRAVEKRDRYVAALEQQHEAAGGTIVQRLGDGSLSMFPSALAAVQAAVAMQRELASADVPVRIGIHVGEVLIEPERLTGDAVNVAARVESFAIPGSVFVSDAVYEQLKNQSGVEVVPLGSFRLKNVGRPLDLYAVAGSDLIVPDRAVLEGKGEIVAAIRATVPQPGSSLLGRDRELRRARRARPRPPGRHRDGAGRRRQDTSGDRADPPAGSGFSRRRCLRRFRRRGRAVSLPTYARCCPRRKGGRGAVRSRRHRRVGRRAEGAALARQP